MAHAISAALHARDVDFYLEQAKACRAIAHLQVHPSHRATFLRLALHWRTVAQSIGDLAERTYAEGVPHV